MAEIYGRVARRARRIQVPQVEPIVVESASVAKGMNTEADPADISEEELTMALNCVVRGDKLRRRPGTLAYSVAEPNSAKILGLFEYKRTNNINNFIRATKASVYYTTAGAWVLCTPGAALTGGDNDRFRAAVVNDRFFFANNGVDEIQELDLTTNTYADAGNWGKYKFITGFHDRVVAAYLGGSTPNPVEIAWSAIGVYDETDPGVNSSAGVTPLVESSSDFTDFISGIFGFNNTMVVARERSIWYTPKLPSGTNPFNFLQAVPGIGSNAPDAIVRIPSGIIFPDWRNEDVYIYSNTNEVRSVGRRIVKDLFASISDPSRVFAGYNPTYAEYTIYCPQADDYIIAWKYNLRFDAWTKCEYYGISAVSNVDNSRASTTIDELTGTMDSLASSYNDLSSTSQSPPQEIFGRIDGKIVTVVDGANLTDANVGATASYAFSSDVRSKTFKHPAGELEAHRLSFDFIPVSEGSMNLYYSKDDGVSWTSAKSWTFAAATLGKPIRVNWKQGKRFKRLQWKLECSTMDFELISYSGTLNVNGEVRAGA
jgi:hypothetical protein